MTTNVIELPKSESDLASNAPPTLQVLERPTKEGTFWLLVSAIMFTTGLFKGINLLVLLAYLLLGLWFLNWIMVRHFGKRLRARRLPHEPIVVGSPIEFQIEIHSTGNHSARGVVIEDRGPEHVRGWMILRLEAETPTRLRFQHMFRKRGRDVATGLRARTQFPFGLVSRTVELTPSEEWIVLPRLGLLHVERLKQWLARNSRGDGRVRRHRLQPALQEAEIHGLRDFRPGDSPRWIHWRSSARRNQILVRQFEDNSAPELVLVVEPWLPASPSLEALAQLEALITMSATLCREWCREHLARLTVVIACPETIFLPAGGGSEFTLRALEALAVQEGSLPQTASAWVDRIQPLKSTTLVLVLTSRHSSTLSAEIADFLGRPVAQVVAGEDVPWFSNNGQLTMDIE